MSRARSQSAPLYRRLPPGPSALTRGEVERNQRTRIFGAMIEAVARHGYGATRVADVIALAGVSRRAFYELFADKEDCFLATHDIVVAQARRRMIEAWRGETAFSARLHAASMSVLDRVAAEPNGARLALVEVGAVGLPARVRMHLTTASFEQLVMGAFRTAPQEARMPPLAARALVGGARHLMAERLRAGRAHELRGLGSELLDWALAYATPMAGRLGELRVPVRAPAAAGGPVPGLLLSTDERTRALEGLTLLALEHDGTGFTDADVARRAGLTTEAFHRQFTSRDACWLALLGDLAAEGTAAARAARAGASSWPEAVVRGLDGFLAHARDHLELVRIAFVHVFGAGAAVAARMTGSVEGLVGELTAGAPAPRYGAPILRAALAGALWTILAGCATGARLAHLAGAVHQLAFVVLAPYLGARAAVEALQGARLAARAR